MNMKEDQPHSKPSGPHPAMVRACEHEWVHNAWIITPLIDYNLAYLVAARDAKRVPGEALKLLAKALLDLRGEGLAAIPYRPERDGLQPNLEAEITARIGAEAGGWLSIGRARQECEMVSRQIAERDDMLALLGSAATLLEALAALARRDADAIMPYYTWMQHAEPITFGYFAAATGHAVACDCARLEQAFRRMDTARAGAGQVVPPPFTIDREKIAALLGFESVMPNSMHAYSSLDVEIEVLSACTILCANLARLAETLFVWAAPEFGFLRFAPEFTGTSYAMPQKQNPYALRQARPVAGRATGALNDAILLFSGSLPPVGNGVVHIPNRVISLLGEVNDLCTLLSAALPTLTLDRERMRQGAATGWAEAPQLVFYLVERHGVSFRQAHEVSGRVVHACLEKGIVAADLPGPLVEQCIVATTGEPVAIDEADMRAAMRPEAIVESRSNGGPAPDSVRKDADGLTVSALGLAGRVEAKRGVLEEAARALAESARTLA